jgi:hypothetical protein
LNKDKASTAKLLALSYRFAVKAVKPKHIPDAVFFTANSDDEKRPIRMTNKKVSKVG